MKANSSSPKFFYITKANSNQDVVRKLKFVNHDGDKLDDKNYIKKYNIII